MRVSAAVGGFAGVGELVLVAVSSALEPGAGRGGQRRWSCGQAVCPGETDRAPRGMASSPLAVSRALLWPCLMKEVIITFTERLWSLLLIPDPPGHGAVQPALGDPASAGGFDQMTHRGPCQPLPCWDSVGSKG